MHSLDWGIQRNIEQVRIIDEVIGRVEKSGGKIIAPKFKMGDAGWIAFMMDTEGNTVGLHRFK